MKKLSEFLKKVEWRDPMILILCGLLLFLVVGSGIHGIAEMSEKETVICIDAAFGGSLSGYEGKIDEAEVTGKVADELASLLDQNRNFRIIRTDRSDSVKQRTEQINREKPDFVLSIHAGGSMNPDDNGMHNICALPNAENADASMKMAECISDSFADNMDHVFTGYMYYCKSGDAYEMKYVDQKKTEKSSSETYQMLQLSGVPTVISDFCRVTSVSDVKNWCNEKGYKKAAQLYYQAILNYYGK